MVGRSVGRDEGMGAVFVTGPQGARGALCGSSGSSTMTGESLEVLGADRDLREGRWRSWKGRQTGMCCFLPANLDPCKSRGEGTEQEVHWGGVRMLWWREL